MTAKQSREAIATIHMGAFKSGDILFKCRLCGAVFKTCHSPDLYASVWYAATSIELDPKVCRHPQAPCLYEMHHCEDGNWGLADLVGARADKEGNGPTGEG